MRVFMFDESGLPATARVFSWPSGSALYRHTSGQRVLLDWDGPGEIEVLAAPYQVHVQDENGERLLEGNRIKVEDHAVLFGPMQGDFLAIARSGPTAPSSGFSPRVSVEGCGWVMAGSPGLIVDGNILPAFDEPAAIPFWRSVKCDGEAPVLLCTEFEIDLVDQFRIADTAALKDRAWKVQNISDTYSLASTFSDGTPHEDLHASHLNVGSWQVEIDGPAEGLILEKTYDRFHGRQRARVFINGGFMGWWYEPGENRIHRWAKSHFVAGLKLPAGRHQLTIAIDPPSGTALWDASEYRLFAIRPKNV